MARGRKAKHKRPMRYPNGYGTVYQLSNAERRRHPWVVKVPKGYEFVEKNGKKKSVLKYEVLAYCDSWEEGNAILTEYNRKKALGIEVIKDNMTFKEVYDLALSRRIDGATYSTVNSYRSGFNHCKDLYNVPVKDIKTAHMQIIVDRLRSEGLSSGTLALVRKVCNTVFDYAVQNDLTDKQYASFLSMGKKTETKAKHIFSEQEIKTLFANDKLEWVDTVLIMIYTGVRINELLKIKNEDVYIEDRYLITGSKTEAGRDRIIPLNKKIICYIKKWYDPSKIYLIRQEDDDKYNEDKYRQDCFYELMDKLNMVHTPHECRHTCASLMDGAGVNKVSQQLILGHKGKDVTEQVYIHKTIEQLIDAIDMI